jgi:hypothetical protein
VTQELFPIETPQQKPATRCPEELNPAELRKLQQWAEDHVPWVIRGALGSLTPLDEYVDACLGYFHGTKKMRPGWLGTVKTWIRKDERQRLEGLARRGDQSARLALTKPIEWRTVHDRAELPEQTRLPDEPRTSCPTILPEPHLTTAIRWAADRGVNQSELAFRWERVRRWADQKAPEPRTAKGWYATLQNAVEDHWGGDPSKPVDESWAEGKQRRTRENAVGALEILRKREASRQLALNPAATP